MQIWRSFDDVPADVRGVVATIGNFDGVHRGHQQVIAQARRVATEQELSRVVAVTFDPHPMAVLRPEHAPPTLTSIKTRAELLAQHGVDAALVIPFNRDVAAWSPTEFVDRVVVETLHARAVVVGANFRFGHKAAGDVPILTALGADRGVAVTGVDLDGGPQVWSSTYVRQCLMAGDVAGAAEALGRAPVVQGTVVVGDRRGRELGFPTANVPVPPDELGPADGVYAGWLTRLDTMERWPAAISVGANPTFPGERASRVEAYVLDRDDLELYGVAVKVEFVAWLRDMAAFDGIEALVERMRDDVRRTREVLKI